ncbi:MAG: homoserine O-acetyltransferase [Gammaproteobacteria bacterium]|nr:homoserine O-acetyltransferase [Gammaproteobacteria bacterium]
MSDSRGVPGAVGRVNLAEPLALYRGGVLREVEIAWERVGELREGNLLLLFTGLSPNAHAASSTADPSPGWWEAMIGPGKAIDTDRWCVLCMNSLGSCFGSTGPASINPATGERYRLDFPALALQDVARAARAALKELHMPAPQVVCGPSLGGMSAQAFVLQFPDLAPNLVLISTAMQARPFAIAIRSLQREAIREDPAWDHGRYPEDVEPVMGMRLARKIGMLSYRSPDEWLERFGRDRVAGYKPGSRADFGIEFEIESYLEAHAERFVGSFDANCYLYLSHAMDDFDVAEHGDGDIDKALARLEAEQALVIGVESDILFPPAQQRDLGAALQRAGVDVATSILESRQGHDSFLVDHERFAAAVGAFLDKL